MKWIKKNKIIISILLLALIFRLGISHITFHVDVYSNAAWGEWISKNGPLNFYQTKGWFLSEPTQPPLISLVYGFNYYIFEQKFLWFLSYTTAVINTHNFFPQFFSPLFNFLTWFNSLYGETPHRTGFLVTMKLIPIIADLAIGLIIFILAKRVSNIKRAVLLCCLYLFLPFSWYLSSLWGQYDQVSFLFVILSFLSLLNKKLMIISPLLFVISIGVKPTSLVFIPLYLCTYILQKPPFLNIIIGWCLALGSLVLQISVFTNQNIMEFSREVLIPKMFEKGDSRIVNNAFNFWKIFIGEKLVSQSEVLVLMPTKIWSYLIFGILNIYSFFIIKKNPQSLENIFKVMFLVGAGSFMFLTNMLERYFFAGIVALLFLTVYKPKLLKYFLILSAIFWLNLYKEWWFPQSIDFLKEVIRFNDYLIVKILAFINTAIFLKILYTFRFKKYEA